MSRHSICQFVAGSVLRKDIACSHKFLSGVAAVRQDEIVSVVCWIPVQVVVAEIE